MLPAPILSVPLFDLRPWPALSRRSFRAAWRWVLLFAGLFCSIASAAVPTEYQVKAAFLFNFTKFVDWPPDRFASSDDPIVIAVLGRNPFGDELENLVRNRLVDGHRIIVRVVSSDAAAKSPGPTAHVLFVPAGEEARFASFLERMPHRGVLTVGESDRFAALGGMLNFILVESRVRFEINRAAAETAELKLRAQLQKLAAPTHRPAGGAQP